MNRPMHPPDRRLTPAREDLADERLRGIVPAARYVVPSRRRVVEPAAALRRAPARDAPLDTEALIGEAVRVYDDHEGWAWVQLEADGYVGYLSAEALGDIGPAAPTHRIAALGTFLYPAPDMKTPPLARLPLGGEVAILAGEGDYVRLAAGAFAGSFAFARHLAPLDAPERDWVAVAERLLGAPYLWGGKTPLGLDCSGLVQLALTQAGIAAPRDSDLQGRDLGAPIESRPDLGGLERGDLVFWRGHVGIMVDPQRLLHANGHHMAVALEPWRKPRPASSATALGQSQG
jgi:cell wall-associated NlpC family hydrolase